MVPQQGKTLLKEPSIPLGPAVMRLFGQRDFGGPSELGRLSLSEGIPNALNTDFESLSKFGCGFLRVADLADSRPNA